MTAAPTTRARLRGLPERQLRGFALRTRLEGPAADTLVLPAQKTMYGGKMIAAGDTVFLFANERGGGAALVARATVVFATPAQRLPGLSRQTPRVRITVRPTAQAARRLGRDDLRPFDRWDDGLPQTELNFKLYRQATDKIVGLSDDATEFLHRFFPSP